MFFEKIYRSNILATYLIDIIIVLINATSVKSESTHNHSFEEGAKRPSPPQNSDLAEPGSPEDEHKLITVVEVEAEHTSHDAGNS